MWMEKIRHGVLEVQTDKGLCYLRPSLGERIRLLWTFRNFQLLPQQVLKQREQTLVATLLERGKVQRDGDCRIGIIEWLGPSSPPQPVRSKTDQAGAEGRDVTRLLSVSLSGRLPPARGSVSRRYGPVDARATNQKGISASGATSAL